MTGDEPDDLDPQADREIVRRLFAAALEAVEPARAVRATLSFHNGDLCAEEACVPAPAGVHVVAVGKAAVAMTRGALASLGEAIVSGDVITKEGHVDSVLPSRIRVREASHPIPDERCVAATSDLLAKLDELDERVVVLALISGGGSALLEAPARGLTLADLAKTTDVMLRAGATIQALNAVRSPLSRVKGGGVRAAAPRSHWITLVLSDVLGNDPRVIASGPTVPGGRDASRALEVIAAYGVADALPERVLHALRDQPVENERAASDDAVIIVGDNAQAVSAAAAKAAELDLATRIAWTATEGEAAELGRAFVDLAAAEPVTTDVLLGGGEATVTVRGSGCGGRNTEFALAAALELEARGFSQWMVASLATDGQDALTGLAGAIADAGTASRARGGGIDPEAALADNDSVAIFAIAGGAVETGPTGTNVNDIYMAVRRNRRVAGNTRS